VMVFRSTQHECNLSAWKKNLPSKRTRIESKCRTLPQARESR
jgi:hypothetical protein